jgi:Flp pilus assembly pilin Flp
MKHLLVFWQKEQGQDLIEYTLLLSFLALASAALLINAGAGLKGFWTTANAGMANMNAGYHPGL